MDRTSNPAPDAPQSDCLRDRIKPTCDDPCVERGTTIAFGAQARAEVQKAVQEIIAILASFTTRECDGGGERHQEGRRGLPALGGIVNGSGPVGVLARTGHIPPGSRVWRARGRSCPDPGEMP